MTSGPDDSDVRDELLAEAVRVAWRVAVEDSRDPNGSEVPAPLRPMVRFRKLPPAAATVIRQVLAEDDDFRRLVARRSEGERLGRASALFLRRPDGWREEIDRLAEELVAADAQRAERSASQRAAALETELAEARAALAAAALDAESQHAALARSAGVIEELRERVSVLEADVDELAAARQRAVRELKLTEKRLAERTSQWKAALASSEPTPTGAAEPAADPIPGPELPPAAPDGDGPTEMGLAEVNRLRAHVDAIDEILRRVAGPSATLAVGNPSDAGASPPNVGTRRSPRRIPPRPERGLIADSAAGLEWLAARPGAVVLVDGYNVAIRTWGQLELSLQRDRLVAVSEALALRSGAEIHLVFDGDDAGPHVARGRSRVRQEFTAPGVEADDRILDMIDSVAPNRPVVVVSDDRRVRAGAGDRGAVAVGVASFVAATR